MSLPLPVVLGYIVAAVVVGMFVGGLIRYVRPRSKLESAKPEPEELPRWEVSTEPRSGFHYLDGEGKPKGEAFVCMVVYCARKGSPDVVIGQHDARKADVQREVAKLEEQAEEHCTTLNAMDLMTPRSRWR